MFPMETFRKKTAVILKCIDQLPQNLARLHNFVQSFDTNHKSFILTYSSYCFHYILLFVFCSSFDAHLDVQAVR